MNRCGRCGLSVEELRRTLPTAALLFRADFTMSARFSGSSSERSDAISGSSSPGASLKLCPPFIPETRENNTNSILSTAIVRKPAVLNPAQTDRRWCSTTGFWIRSGCLKGLLKPKNILSFLMKAASSSKGD